MPRADEETNSTSPMTERNGREESCTRLYVRTIHTCNAAERALEAQVEEMAFHLAKAAEEHMARGLPEPKALACAKQSFGSVTEIQDKRSYPTSSKAAGVSGVVSSVLDFPGFPSVLDFCPGFPGFLSWISTASPMKPRTYCILTRITRQLSVFLSFAILSGQGFEMLEASILGPSDFRPQTYPLRDDEAAP
jgi:hypothetical protein